MADDDDVRVDRPQDLPAQQSAVDPKEAKKRLTAKQHAERKMAEWVRRQLADPDGRQFFWGVLVQTGAFITTGKTNTQFATAGAAGNAPEMTWFLAGKKEVGMELYHQLAKYDRSGLLDLFFEKGSDFKDAPPAPRTH